MFWDFLALQHRQIPEIPDRQGKSLQFEICVVVGYLFGITGKFIGGNVTYVLAVYILDVLMVSTDIVLTCRNRRLDRLAEAKEGALRNETGTGQQKSEKARGDE